MSIVQLSRFEVRADAIADVEAAMRTYADHVRRELPDSSWTTYRDPHAPARFVAILHVRDDRAHAVHRASPGTVAFDAALAGWLVAPPEVSDCALVTSSDLARRPPRAPRRGGGSPTGARGGASRRR